MEKISVATVIISIFLSTTLLFSYTVVNGQPVDRYWTVLQADEKGRLKSNATGFFGIKFREDFKQLVYNVNVNNIENITGIYLYSRGNETTNQTMILDLLQEAKEVKVKDIYQETKLLLNKTKQIEGTVAVGGVTSEDLGGELKGKSLEALHRLLVSGDTYVVVTTKKFPKGEIAGSDFTPIERFFPDSTDFRWK